MQASSDVRHSCSPNFDPVVVFLMLVAVSLSAQQPRPSHPAGNPDRIARAADTVLCSGVKAKIPPHVSQMLGVTSDLRECPVSQRVERAGKLVRGFNVSLTDKNDIVLIVADEAAKEQTYYLTSSDGWTSEGARRQGRRRTEPAGHE